MTIVVIAIMDEVSKSALELSVTDNNTPVLEVVPIRKRKSAERVFADVRKDPLLRKSARADGGGVAGDVILVDTRALRWRALEPHLGAGDPDQERETAARAGARGLRMLEKDLPSLTKDPPFHAFAGVRSIS
jgi:hypothetical protein